MKKKQIERFVKKINYDVELPVTYYSKKGETPPVAQATTGLNPKIHLNICAICRMSDKQLKGVILHEMGHIHTNDFTAFCVSLNKIRYARIAFH